uniref:Uncharacterized protein n=1 Tax=uncultured marine virus TaxID=186617 RepID=A0A0F7L5D1_9VIRU|nr:hypothetical protein [uncultured marine virus]
MVITHVALSLIAQAQFLALLFQPYCAHSQSINFAGLIQFELAFLLAQIDTY